jgi:hypothetical protein
MGMKTKLSRVGSLRCGFSVVDRLEGQGMGVLCMKSNR